MPIKDKNDLPKGAEKKEKDGGTSYKYFDTKKGVWVHGFIPKKKKT